MEDVLLIVATGITQLVLGYMGVHVSLRPPLSKHHKYWIAAFVLVGGCGIYLTGWLALRAAKEQTSANVGIHDAQEAATNANISATNANNAATAAQRETAAAREEARKATSVLEEQNRNNFQVLSDIATGGDSICYFSASVEGSEQPPTIVFRAVLEGKFNIPAFILRISRRFVPREPDKQITLPLCAAEAYRWPMPEMRDAYSFVLTYSTINGTCSEVIYLRKVGGTWKQALTTNIAKGKGLSLNKQIVDQGYPTIPGGPNKGSIDWD